MSKTALITGIAGQDGAYLARLLLDEGYLVHGVERTTGKSVDPLDHVPFGSRPLDPRFALHYGDLTDGTSLVRVLRETRPDEIYNLGAQSHVKVSFETPEQTADVDALGTLRLLEALRALGMEKTTRYYQASTSEMFGTPLEVPQRETTPFCPCSPLGAAKVYAHWITVTYREAYGIHASSGILFDHESPIRDETFVTRKISRGVARIALGLQDVLRLGDLEAKRDWGHARDYVRSMYLMLQQDEPGDYVVATGEQHSVREFVERTFAEVGVEVHWQGEGLDEVGMVESVDLRRLTAARNGLDLDDTQVPADGMGPVTPGSIVVRIDSRFFRPTEVPNLMGDASKARERLGWEPTVTFEELVHDMLRHDLIVARGEEVLHAGGLAVGKSER